MELEADQLLDVSLHSLSTIHEQVRAAGLKPAAVGFSSFWHSLVRVDWAGKPTTPLLHLFDTRSAKQVRELEQRLDPKRIHARTGCVLHSSYWPAKLLWLRETRPDAFRRDISVDLVRGISVPEVVWRRQRIHVHGFGHRPVEPGSQQLRR